MTFALIIIFLLILFFLFVKELYFYIFCRKSSRLFTKLFDTKGHEEEYYRFRDNAAKRLSETSCEKLTIVNRRGEKLKGYYYPCGANGKTIAFIIHGYRSDHLDTGGMFYDYYKSRGIDFFCCDHTASGESEGKYIGFDIFETEDCLLWIDFLKEKFGEDIKIILHGFSMGAATVLKMSSRCPLNVKFIVSDSAYTKAKVPLYPKIGPMYGIMRFINILAAHYDWNDSDVTESLNKSKIPVLFVHGRDDKFVPFSCGEELFTFYKGDKDFLFPNNTRHIESMYKVPELYYEKLDLFKEKYL